MINKVLFVLWNNRKESNIYNSDVICHNETKLVLYLPLLIYLYANIEYTPRSSVTTIFSLHWFLVLKYYLLSQDVYCVGNIVNRKINYCLRQKFRMISYFEEASVAWKLCEVEQLFKSNGQSLLVELRWLLSGMNTIL